MGSQIPKWSPVQMYPQPSRNIQQSGIWSHNRQRGAKQCGERKLPWEASLPCSSCKRETESGSACLGFHHPHDALRFDGTESVPQGRVGGGHSLSLSPLSPLLPSGSQLKCHITGTLPCHPSKASQLLPPPSRDHCPS